MEFKLKSALIHGLWAGFAVVFTTVWLAGCSGNGPSPLPHAFSGIEVPQDVLDEPRVVETPPPFNPDTTTYPRLGDVPSKPNNFSPPPVINQAISEMQSDRAQAQGDLNVVPPLSPVIPSYPMSVTTPVPQYQDNQLKPPTFRKP